MLNRTATIYPRVREHGGTWGELQLGDLLLHPFVGQGYPLDVQNFLGIALGMDAGAEAHIALDTHSGQIDDGLVQNVLDGMSSAKHDGRARGVGGEPVRA